MFERLPENSLMLVSMWRRSPTTTVDDAGHRPSLQHCVTNRSFEFDRRSPEDVAVLRASFLLLGSLLRCFFLSAPFAKGRGALAGGRGNLSQMRGKGVER